MAMSLALSSAPHAKPEMRSSGSHGGRVVASSELLQGNRLVEIRHNGETYRLQATRLGKLILTK